MLLVIGHPSDGYYETLGEMKDWKSGQSMNRWTNKYNNMSELILQAVIIVSIRMPVFEKTGQVY